MARFSVWAAVALLSNWYMGFIVLLFTGIWLTWEYVFEKAEGKLIDRNVLIFVGRLGAAICIGWICSCSCIYYHGNRSGQY